MIVPITNNVDTFGGRVLRDLVKAVDQREIPSGPNEKAETFRLLVQVIHQTPRDKATVMFQQVYKHFVFGFAIFVEPNESMLLLAALGNPTYSIISDKGIADVLLVTMSLDAWVTFILAQHNSEHLTKIAKHLRSYFEQHGYSFILWNTTTTR